MAVFEYKAMMPNGTPVDGEINLASELEVQGYLKEKEYYIVEIKEKKKTDTFSFEIKTKIKPKDLSVFCRKLHAMLISGLPIVTAVDILREQTGHRRVKSALNKVFEDLQKGMTFSEALNQHPNIFPDNMIFLIEAGEMSGTIDHILDRLAIDFEKDAKIRNKIRSAMVYPILLGFMLVALVVFMVVFILPRFMVMFESADMELPKLTQMVIAMSESLSDYWYFYLPGLIGLIVAVGIIRKIPSIRRRIDRLKLDLPGFKNYNRLLVTTRFTRTLSTMLFSGVPLLQSLENISRAIGNVIVAEKIIEVANEVRRGSDLATPIKKADVFPRMVDSMINIGEESGTLDDILVRTTSYFDDELETTIKRMTQLFEPAMIVLMGVVVGTIVLAMVMPMFEIANTV
jgi:type IV pilus assembly protein PilC